MALRGPTRQVNTVSEAAKQENPWGRVDEDRTVYVREGDTERVVGSYPDGTPAEALAYFERKFEDLAGQVHLLATRIERGTADGNVADAVKKLQEQLVEPAAVGDLASLRAEAEKLAEKAAAFVEQQKAEREAARAAALERREAIVAEAEQLAAVPANQMHWRKTGERFQELFAAWQAEQRGSVHIPKSVSDALWKRFRSARSSFESARHTHYRQVDAHNREVRDAKEQLIKKAEELAEKGAAGVPAYRQLLDEWKRAGRGSRKHEDAQWARFKAAGDVLFAARAAEAAQTNEEYAANLAQKEAILGEAQAILEITDHKQARKELTQIQVRWDEIGRVPREALRDIEGRLRAIEDHVAALEDEHWRRTNPETKARSEGLRGQLEESIAQLEAEIAAAKESGDAAAEKAATEKLETQKSWLAALGEFNN